MLTKIKEHLRSYGVYSDEDTFQMMLLCQLFRVMNHFLQ